MAQYATRMRQFSRHSSQRCSRCCHQAGAAARDLTDTFSIATGIALGFISYVAVKLLSGRIAEAGPVMSALALLFVMKYALF
jgi:hypothetical protein